MTVAKVIGHQYQASYRDAPHKQLVEPPAGGPPELHIEGAGTEPHGALTGGVVGVADGEQQPTRRVAALAKSSSEPLAHRPQQAPQFMAVIGVARQLVFRPALGPHLRWQHRAEVDPVGVAVQGATGATEGHLQRQLAERGDLADLFEVIVVESLAHPIGKIRKEDDRFGRQERRLMASGHRPDVGTGFALDHRGGRLAHQLVDGDADGDGQPELVAEFTFEPAGHLDGRPEEPLGTGDIEVGMAPAAWLDHRGNPGEDFMDGPVGSGPPAGIRGTDDQVRADPSGQCHRGPPFEPSSPRLDRQRQQHRPVGAGRGHGHRPVAE